MPPSSRCRRPDARAPGPLCLPLQQAKADSPFTPLQSQPFLGESELIRSSFQGTGRSHMSPGGRGWDSLTPPPTRAAPATHTTPLPRPSSAVLSKWLRLQEVLSPPPWNAGENSSSLIQSWRLNEGTHGNCLSRDPAHSKCPIDISDYPDVTTVTPGPLRTLA